MRADIHDGPEHMLQSEAGYIDARPLTPARQNLLQRTAGPYIWVINGPSVASELGPFIPRQRTSPACPWGSITYVDLHGMEAMMTGKLSPEGEVIAAYGAAMVAAIQV